MNDFSGDKKHQAPRYIPPPSTYSWDDEKFPRYDPYKMEIRNFSRSPVQGPPLYPIRTDPALRSSLEAQAKFSLDDQAKAKDKLLEEKDSQLRIAQEALAAHEKKLAELEEERKGLLAKLQPEQPSSSVLVLAQPPLPKQAQVPAALVHPPPPIVGQQSEQIPTTQLNLTDHPKKVQESEKNVGSGVAAVNHKDEMELLNNIRETSAVPAQEPSLHTERAMNDSSGDKKHQAPRYVPIQPEYSWIPETYPLFDYRKIEIVDMSRKPGIYPIPTDQALRSSPEARGEKSSMDDHQVKPPEGKDLQLKIAHELLEEKDLQLKIAHEALAAQEKKVVELEKKVAELEEGKKGLVARLLEFEEKSRGYQAEATKFGHC